MKLQWLIYRKFTVFTLAVPSVCSCGGGGGGRIQLGSQHSTGTHFFALVPAPPDRRQDKFVMLLTYSKATRTLYKYFWLPFISFKQVMSKICLICSKETKGVVMSGRVCYFSWLLLWMFLLSFLLPSWPPWRITWRYYYQYALSLPSGSLESPSIPYRRTPPVPKLPQKACVTK